MIEGILAIAYSIIANFITNGIYSEKISKEEIEKCLRKAEREKYKTIDDALISIIKMSFEDLIALGDIKTIDEKGIEKIARIVLNGLKGVPKETLQDDLDKIMKLEGYKWTPHVSENFLNSIQNACSMSPSITSWLNKERHIETMISIKQLSQGQGKIIEAVNSGVEKTIRAFDAKIGKIFEKNNQKEKTYKDISSQHLNNYMFDIRTMVNAVRWSWPNIRVKTFYKFKIKFEDGEEINRLDILNRLLHNTTNTMVKICLVGKAGTGKSNVLYGILKEIIEQEIQVIPIILDLSKANGMEYDAEEKLQLENLFKKTLVASNWPMVERIIDFIKNSTSVPTLLLMADGLNEIGNKVLRKKIIETLDDFTDNFESKLLIISDRIPLEKDNFINMEIQKISEEEIKEIYESKLKNKLFKDLLETSKDILSLSYFLNWFATREGLPQIDVSKIRFDSFSEAFQSYFDFHFNAGHDSFLELSEFAFQTLKNNKGVIFSIDELDDKFKKYLISQKEIISIGTNQFKFEHQLKHEFLASKFLVNHETEWTHESFDCVSLDSGSFELFEMAIEQIADANLGDKFIKSLYDWKWQAAVNCIIYAEKMDLKSLSPQLKSALIAIISMKQNDIILKTKLFSQKMLSNISNECDLKRIVTANTPIQIYESIEHIDSNDKNSWFFKWKELFRNVTKPDEGITAQEIDLIKHDNSILGWGCANLIKIKDLTKADVRQLSTIYMWYLDREKENIQNTKNIRWRIVHALGASSSQENIEFLFGVMQDDPDETQWVHYGAGRSLIEIAANNDNCREYIFEGLIQCSSDFFIKSLTRLSEDFKLSIKIDDWNSSAVNVLNSFKTKLEKHPNSVEIVQNAINNLQT